MPSNPHCYTLRRQWDSDADFIFAVKAIRDYGHQELFKGREYTVLDLDGFRYWTMGCPIHPDPNHDPRRNTILINRRSV